MTEENAEPAELPRGWTLASLEDVAEIIRGISFKKDQRTSEHEEGRIACLRTTNVQKQVEWGNLWFVPKELVKKQTQLLQPNDVLISMSNSLGLVGKVAQASMIPHEATIGAFISIIRVAHGLDPVYFFNLLASYEVQSAIRKTASTTTNISNISNASLNRISLKMPPLNEQHRIVAKVEELFTNLDAGVEALKKVQAQTKLYRQAVLKYAFEGKLTAEWREAHKDGLEPASVVLERIQEERKKKLGGKYKEPSAVDISDLPDLPDGWLWTNIGVISTSMTNGIYKQKHFYSDDGVACLRMYNIDDWRIVWKDIKRMNLTPEEMEGYGLKPGDILVNRVNSWELVGKSAIIPDGLETCVYESKNIRLRLNGSHVSSSYLQYWLQLHGHKYFSRNFQQTTGMASINQTQLGLMEVPLTSMEEQIQIVEEIERRFSIADEIQKVLEQSVRQSDRLRQSILKKAFEGQLVPQDPNDEPAEKLLGRIREERAKQSAGAKKAKSRRSI